MIKGFIRIGVVTILLTWIVVAVLQWMHLQGDIWLINGHISPYLRDKMNDTPPSDDYWAVYAAKPEFLELSENKRAEEASRFYEQQVRPLEDVYYVGIAQKFKEWMHWPVSLLPTRIAEELFDGTVVKPDAQIGLFNTMVALRKVGPDTRSGIWYRAF